MPNKYCHNCGKKQMSSMLICPQCGSRQFSDEPVAIIPVDEVKKGQVETSSNTVLPKISGGVSSQNDPVSNYSPTLNKSEVRPWVRFWARYIDISTFSLSISFLIGLIFPNYMAESNYFILGIEWVFLYVFIESIFISGFGSSFGKWLLKTKVVPINGAINTYESALKRSFHVWWRGWGAGIPIFYLIPLIISYRTLNNQNITPWDKSSGYVVKHEKIGVLRIIVATVLILSYVALFNYNLKTSINNQMNKLLIESKSQVSL